MGGGFYFLSAIVISHYATFCPPFLYLEKPQNSPGNHGDNHLSRAKHKFSWKAGQKEALHLQHSVLYLTGVKCHIVYFSRLMAGQAGEAEPPPRGLFSRLADILLMVEKQREHAGHIRVDLISMHSMCVSVCEPHNRIIYMEICDPSNWVSLKVAQPVLCLEVRAIICMHVVASPALCLHLQINLHFLYVQRITVV